MDKDEEVKGQELVKKKSKEEVKKNPLVDGLAMYQAALA